MELNYTTARSPDPDLEVVSSNCALGRELAKLYAADTDGQEAYDLLQTAADNLATAKLQLETFDRILLGRSAYMPPMSPPPPPPPDYLNAPPNAPEAITFEERRAQLEQAVVDYTTEVHQRNAAISACAPSTTTTCGRTSVEAPNPWLAKDGAECFGYSTQEALEGAYCGYWGSTVRHAFEHQPFLTRPTDASAQFGFVDLCLRRDLTLWIFACAGQRRGRRGRGGRRAAEHRRRALLLQRGGTDPQVPGDGAAHRARGRQRAQGASVHFTAQDHTMHIYP